MAFQKKPSVARVLDGFVMDRYALVHRRDGRAVVCYVYSVGKREITFWCIIDGRAVEVARDAAGSWFELHRIYAGSAEATKPFTPG